MHAILGTSDALRVLKESIKDIHDFLMLGRNIFLEELTKTLPIILPEHSFGLRGSNIEIGVDYIIILG